MRKLQLIAFIWATLACCALAHSQKKATGQQKAPELPQGYTLGPASIPLSEGAATLTLPKGFLYLDVAAASKFLAETKQPPQPNLAGMIVEPEGVVDWYLMLKYNRFGHINDDGAEEALKENDKLLDALKKNTHEAYSKLPPGSAPEPVVLGWFQPPTYLRPTRALSISTVAQEGAEPEQTVNFNTILLGRYGGMSCTAVGGKKDAAYISSKLEQLTPGVRFTPGNDYSSWVAADGDSEIAFTSLVTGGAALAAAAKTGLLAKLGSFLLYLVIALKKALIAVIAGIVALVRWIQSKFRGSSVEPVSSTPTPPTDI